MVRNAVQPIPLMRTLRSIQCLRAVAALLVVWAHASNTMPGRVGVHIFFVISGFIIGRIAKGRPPARFIVDRLWRIYPVYWIAVLPWLLVAFYTGAASPDRVAASISLWPVYGSYVEPYLRPAWSLCFEMLFYVAMFAAMLTRKGEWIVAAFLACFAFNLIHPTPLTEFVGSWEIFEFLGGLALSRVSLVDGAEPWFRTPAFDPLVFLGNASYSIYLVHMLVTELFDQPWPVLFLGAVALGCAFHILVERPLLGLRHKIVASVNAARV